MFDLLSLKTWVIKNGIREYQKEARSVKFTLKMRMKEGFISIIFCDFRDTNSNHITSVFYHFISIMVCIVPTV